MKKYQRDGLIALGLTGATTIGIMGYGATKAFSEAYDREEPQIETEHHSANKKLLEACVDNNLEDLKEAIKEGAEINGLNKNGENILTASMHGVRHGVSWGEPLVAEYILDHAEILSKLNLDNEGTHGTAKDVLLSEISNKKGYTKEYLRETVELRTKLQRATDKYHKKMESGKTKAPDGTSYAFYQQMNQGR